MFKQLLELVQWLTHLTSDLPWSVYLKVPGLNLTLVLQFKQIDKAEILPKTKNKKQKTINPKVLKVVFLR